MARKQSADRLAAEKAYHDHRYSVKSSLAPHYRLEVTALAVEDMLARLGDITRKAVLELGCGQGWMTVILAHKRAYVSSIDISSQAVSITQNLVDQMGFSHQVDVRQMAAESLEFTDDSFDIVIGNAILHHTDLSRVSREIWRVLKPGGKAYFLEPLAHNPFINLYRKLTPQFRSSDESPLKFYRIRKLRALFSSLDHNEYFCLALLAFLFQKCIRSDSLFLRCWNFLFRLDKVFLRFSPAFRPFSWYTLIIVTK